MGERAGVLGGCLESTAEKLAVRVAVPNSRRNSGPALRVLVRFDICDQVVDEAAARYCRDEDGIVGPRQ